MTPQELQSRACALYGERWQTALARRVGVAPRAMRYWTTGERQIPDWLGWAIGILERHPEER